MVRVRRVLENVSKEIMIEELIGLEDFSSSPSRLAIRFHDFLARLKILKSEPKNATTY